MRRIDQSYPLKSTFLYVAVALAIDAIALVRASKVEIPSMVVFSAGGALICIPWGTFGAAVCMAIGAVFGALVGVAIKHLFHRYQPAALRLLLSSRIDLELGLLLAWVATAAAAYHLTEWLLFPGAGGAVAAANVLLGRAIILPELNDLYWLASRHSEHKTESRAAVDQARAA